MASRHSCNFQSLATPETTLAICSSQSSRAPGQVHFHLQITLRHSRQQWLPAAGADLSSYPNLTSFSLRPWSLVASGGVHWPLDRSAVDPVPVPQRQPLASPISVQRCSEEYQACKAVGPKRFARANPDKRQLLCSASRVQRTTTPQRSTAQHSMEGTSAGAKESDIFVDPDSYTKCPSRFDQILATPRFLGRHGA